MWRKCHYSRIDELRSAVSKAAKVAKSRGGGDQKREIFDPKTNRMKPAPRVQMKEEIALIRYLQEGIKFYDYMIGRFQKYRDEERDDIFSQCSSAAESHSQSHSQFSFQSAAEQNGPISGSDVPKGTCYPTPVEATIQRLQICVGDLHRYYATHINKYPPPDEPENKSKSNAAADIWQESISAYQSAIETDPGDGNAHNQLAVVYQWKGEDVVAAYYYVRSLLGRDVFPTAESNLRRLLAKALEKFEENVAVVFTPANGNGAGPSSKTDFMANFLGLVGMLFKEETDDIHVKHEEFVFALSTVLTSFKNQKMGDPFVTKLIVISIYCLLNAGKGPKDKNRFVEDKGLKGNGRNTQRVWASMLCFSFAEAMVSMIEEKLEPAENKNLKRPNQVKYLAPLVVFLDFLSTSPQTTFESPLEKEMNTFLESLESCVMRSRYLKAVSADKSVRRRFWGRLSNLSRLLNSSRQWILDDVKAYNGQAWSVKEMMSKEEQDLGGFKSVSGVSGYELGPPRLPLRRLISTNIVNGRRVVKLNNFVKLLKGAETDNKACIYNSDGSLLLLADADDTDADADADADADGGGDAMSVEDKVDAASADMVTTGGGHRMEVKKEASGKEGLGHPEGANDGDDDDEDENIVFKPHSLSISPIQGTDSKTTGNTATTNTNFNFNNDISSNFNNDISSFSEMKAASLQTPIALQQNTTIFNDDTVGSFSDMKTPSLQTPTTHTFSMNKKPSFSSTWGSAGNLSTGMMENTTVTPLPDPPKKRTELPAPPPGFAPAPVQAQPSAAVTGNFFYLMDEHRRREEEAEADDILGDIAGALYNAQNSETETSGRSPPGRINSDYGNFSGNTLNTANPWANNYLQ